MKSKTIETSVKLTALVDLSFELNINKIAEILVNELYDYNTFEDIEQYIMNYINEETIYFTKKYIDSIKNNSLGLFQIEFENIEDYYESHPSPVDMILKKANELKPNFVISEEEFNLIKEIERDEKMLQEKLKRLKILKEKK
jgi:hypothetical protein